VSWISAFAPILAAAVLGGGSAGLLGVFVVGLRMPFLAVASAHAALAGAVIGGLAGLPAGPCGFVGALGGALLLVFLVRDREIDPNVALGTLFSLMLGIAFLGMGLSPGPKSAALNLMWGNLLFVTPSQVAVMGALAAGLLALLAAFHKELKLMLFSREIAGLLIPETTVLGALLVIEAGIITVNLEIVGGLLLYSLICNPAVAALKVARRFGSALALSGALGAASALGGFLAACALDLPVGACIVIVSSVMVMAALGAARWRKR
jgi:manganese/iron transport system permease protein